MTPQTCEYKDKCSAYYEQDIRCSEKPYECKLRDLRRISQEQGIEEFVMKKEKIE